MGAMAPVEIKRTTTDTTNPVDRIGTGVEIKWSDGSGSSISSLTLRKACPCATCRERAGELNHSQPLSPPKRSPLAVIESSVEESLDLKVVWPVGNYALGIQWGDKHDSGIYTYELLRELSQAG